MTAISIQNSIIIFQLPDELTENIYSYLTVEDIQTCAIVSKSFSQETIEKVNSIYLRNARHFLVNISNELRPDIQTTCQKLRSIYAKSFKFLPNLTQLKNHLKSIQDETLLSLERLDYASIKSLRAIRPPTFFENTFVLADLGRKFLKALKITAKNVQSETLENIVNNYIELSELEKAIQVIYSMPKNIRNISFMNCFVEALKLKNYDLAFNIIQQMQTDYKKDIAISMLSNKFREIGDIHRALATIDLFYLGIKKNQLYEQLIFCLSKEDKYEEAVDITKNMLPPELRCSAYTIIAKSYLYRKNDIEKAKVLYDLIHDQKKKANLSFFLTKTYALLKKFDEALECASSIKILDDRDRSLQEIVEALYTSSNLPKALEIAKMIVNKETQSQALSDIVNDLINEKNKPLDALDISMLISEISYSSNCFWQIAKNYYNKKEYIKTIEVLSNIQNTRYLNEALEDFGDMSPWIQELEDQGKLQEAQQLSDLIDELAKRTNS